MLFGAILEILFQATSDSENPKKVCVWTFFCQQEFAIICLLLSPHLNPKVIDHINRQSHCINKCSDIKLLCYNKPIQYINVLLTTIFVMILKLSVLHGLLQLVKVTLVFDLFCDFLSFCLSVLIIVTSLLADDWHKSIFLKEQGIFKVLY